MATVQSQTPRVVEIAQQIETDIRNRRLQPGSSYYTTVETARMLGVNAATANKAMQLLVNRGLLRRRPRLGTVIAHPPEPTDGPVLEHVHLLVHQNYLKTEGLLADGVIVGMLNALKGANVAFNFMPPVDDDNHVRKIVAGVMRSEEKAGFVLVRSSLAAQRQVYEAGLPAVVFGSLHPSVPPMAQIDKDHDQIGQLMTDYVLERGDRRLLLIMRDRLLPGDHLLIDGIRRAMVRRGRDMGSLVIRCLPNDEQAIAYETRRILSNGDDWGIICRSEPLARGAIAGIEAAGKQPDKDIPIAASDVYRRSTENPVPFAHIRTTWTPSEHGACIGRLLAQQARGEFIKQLHHVVPVKLVLPHWSPGDPRPSPEAPRRAATSTLFGLVENHSPLIRCEHDQHIT